MTQIKNRFTGKVICEGIEFIRELAEKNKDDLKNADLQNADLQGADLKGAYLKNAYLQNADLRGADLKNADLKNAYLKNAYLKGADLKNADLQNADLQGADLKGADLKNAYLKNADLRGADLWGAKIEFILFPSIRLLSSIYLGTLSDELTLELMRRDAYAHPHPELFDEWNSGGECPYQNEERFWQFSTQKGIYRKGKPQMTDRDLIVAICNEKGWKIKGYLK